MLDVKPKALSGTVQTMHELEADYESCYLSENLSDRRLKWPNYNMNPKFLGSMACSRDNSPSPKRVYSPSMLMTKPEFAYPQRKVLERDFPSIHIEAECRTTYTNHDSKNLPDTRNTSTKKGTGTEALTTASPSKSPGKITNVAKEKPKVSKNPFHKEKDKDKIKQVQSSTHVSPSKSQRSKNAIDGWQAPAEDYKFPPSKPKLPTVGDMKAGMTSNYSVGTDHLHRGNHPTSLNELRDDGSRKGGHFK